MNPRRFRVPLVLMALVPVGTARGEVLGSHSTRSAFEALAHVNIPGGMAHGEGSNTPVSAPFDPWSFPWELEITDFAVPPHRTGGMTDALLLPDRGAEALPPPASPVPGPGSLAPIVVCAAIRGGRRRRQTSRFFTSRACSSI